MRFSGVWTTTLRRTISNDQYGACVRTVVSAHDPPIVHNLDFPEVFEQSIAHIANCCIIMYSLDNLSTGVLLLRV